MGIGTNTFEVQNYPDRPKDDSMVGWSIALTLAIFGPITSAILWAGRGATRRAVEDAKAWSVK